MNALIIFISLAVYAAAAPSGHGTIVAGPAGIVTSHGAVGTVGHGLGLGGLVGHGGAILSAPVASAVVSGPGLVGHGLGLGLGGLGVGGLGLGGWGLGGGIGLGHGVGVVTNGGGAIGIGHHGVSVHGPPTVPATIVGPSGAITAAGLWGPTLAHGHGGHGW